MGRPTISEPRCRQIKFCLTERELESIRRRAAAVGMRPVHFGRELLLTTHSDAARPSFADEAVANLQRLSYSQLARLGNNLNQLVRHLHQSGDPLPADLEPLLKDIRQIIAKVRP